MGSFDDILRKVTANLSVEELERRLKPREPVRDEGGWSDYSSGGFLAPQESFVDVMRADYDFLNSVGKSYGEMAQLAQRVLDEGYNKYRKKGFGDGLRNLFSSRKIKVGDFDKNNFKIDAGIASGGIQSCPFGCDGNDDLGYATLGSGHIYVEKDGAEESELFEKYFEIQMETDDMESEREKLREIGIEFGEMDRVMYLSSFLVVSDLTPHLIATHNFFQGEASYRTDPRKLLEVFGM
jgi:hypothetical protein